MSVAELAAFAARRESRNRILQAEADHERAIQNSRRDRTPEEIAYDKGVSYALKKAACLAKGMVHD